MNQGFLHKLRGYGSRLAAQYKDFFGVSEIESSQTLVLSAWAILFGWYLEFSTWFRFADFSVNAVAEGRHLCWPFLQTCGNWYFLSLPPLGYSQFVWYAVLFGLLVLSAVALVRKNYTAVHALFLLFFVWEMLVIVMSMRLAVNYWYFHVVFASLFLFSKYKLSFLRLGVVVLYFLSGIIKLNDGWLLGTYFYGLSDGLYLVPDSIIPVATNLVIFLELVAVWFLLSPKPKTRLIVVGALFLFHGYSVLYVGFLYPSIVLPLVLILFLSREPSVRFPDLLHWGRAGAWILFLLILFQAVPYTIAGDARITGEGSKFGMYMFQANYQCISRATFVYAGRSVQETSTSTAAIKRCDPYAHFFYLKNRCNADNTIEKVLWTLDTSINGAPFFRVVDIENACNLSYTPFTHNKWILSPGINEMRIIAPAYKNFYIY